MSARIRLALVAYGAMAGIAVLLGALFGDLDLYHHEAPIVSLGFPAATLIACGAGLSVAGLTVVITRILVRRARWARRLHAEFRERLGILGSSEILVLAVTSGVAEEMLFRGALQPSIGLIASSLVFGLVHVGPNRSFLPWTAWAVVMGFVLGGLYEATGELIAPILAHVLVNYENLHFIQAYDPQHPTDPPRPTPHARGVEDPPLVSKFLGSPLRQDNSKRA